MIGKREEILEGGGLRVRFFMQHDRFAHEIYRLTSDNWQLLLASCEGTPEEDFPASPPLQSLNLESRGERQLALLVGMAGKSHWSVSVELDPAAGSLVFDIACRVRSKSVGPLLSTYQAHLPLSVSGGSGVSLVEPAAGQVWHLSPIVEAPGSWVDSQGDRIRAGADGTDAPPPTTVRWGYRLAPGKLA